MIRKSTKMSSIFQIMLQEHEKTIFDEFPSVIMETAVGERDWLPQEQLVLVKGWRPIDFIESIISPGSSESEPPVVEIILSCITGHGKFHKQLVILVCLRQS